MARTPDEIATTEWFDAIYDLSRSSVLQSITDDACGCGYIGTSWTTQAEAASLLDRLRLDGGSRLLELGAGAGWPGLYLARKSGCRVTLVDLPETGLRLAMERASADGMAERVTCLVADASDLPLPAGAFTAISHSDLLCCLVRKRQVLEECRRVVDPRGRMAFTVISVAPGITEGGLQRAIAGSSQFVEAECGYPEMLSASGWQVLEHEDLTDAYEASCRRMLRAEERREAELLDLLGPEEVKTRREKWTAKLAAIRDRLTLREFFFVRPA